MRRRPGRQPLFQEKGVFQIYLALYRKYRPLTFDDVISQEHITTTLKNQLKNGQTSHAYLFTGSRGTGKTTCAKILAKAINCLNPRDGSPCLECAACRAIADEVPDVVEIDAASNTGVDNVRALKEEAVYTPLNCRYKVYIIDEVHMLSTAAFNALLKLIEEPPPHIVFIFATTELHKVPATILSRCQRFDFKRIDIEDSKKRLLEIAEKEGMTLDGEAAFLISRISDGGMRDALSLLDQCFSFSSHVTEEVVRSCSGISGAEHLFSIADAVIEKNSAKAVSVMDGLVQNSKSPIRLIEELISHYRTLMLLKAGAERSVLRISADEEKQYAGQNQKYSMESILRAISILTEAYSGKNRTKNEQLTCEMCLIRLCTPTLDPDEKTLSGRIDALERTVADLAVNSVGKAAASAVEAPPAVNITPAEPLPAEEIIPEPIMAEDEPFKAAPPEPEKAPPPPEDGAGMTVEMPFEFEAAAFPPEQLEPEPKPDSLSEALGLSQNGKIFNDNPDFEPWQKDKSLKNEPSEEGYEPLKEWNAILDSLTHGAKMLIGDTTALIKDNRLMVCGSELAKSYAVKEFSGEIREAAARVVGHSVIISAEPPKTSMGEEETQVKDFLDFAKAQGVSIKEQ